MRFGCFGRAFRRVVGSCAVAAVLVAGLAPVHDARAEQVLANGIVPQKHAPVSITRGLMVFLYQRN